MKYTEEALWQTRLYTKSLVGTIPMEELDINDLI